MVQLVVAPEPSGIVLEALPESTATPLTVTDANGCSVDTVTVSDATELSTPIVYMEVVLLKRCSIVPTLGMRELRKAFEDKPRETVTM